MLVSSHIGFFDLPGEVRNGIYENYYQLSAYQNDSKNGSSLYFDDTLPSLFDLHRTLCVNRQLYDEASSYLYKIFLPSVSFNLNNPEAATQLVQMIPKEYYVRGINGTLVFNGEHQYIYKDFDMFKMLTLIAKEQSYETIDDLEDHPRYEAWLHTEEVWISRIRVEYGDRKLLIAWHTDFRDGTSSRWLYLGESIGSLKCLEELVLC
jgi:hypothetical protein